MEEIDLGIDNCEITLKPHKVYEEGLSKKILYKVSTLDNLTVCVRYRNSSDFVYLRTQLISKWISLEIPRFPKISFSLLKHLSEECLMRKTRHLERFLKKCVDIQEIFTSEDFQLFIKGPENFTDSSKIEKLDYKDVKIRFSTLYNYLPKLQADSENIEQRNRAYLEMLSSFIAFKKKLKEMHDKILRIKKTHRIMNVELSRAKCIYFSCEKDENTEFSLKVLDEKPLQELLDWVIDQCMSLKSLIEMISKFSTIHKDIMKLKSKMLNNQLKVSKLESGKSSITSLLSSSIPDLIMKNSFKIQEIDNTIFCASSTKDQLYSYLITKHFPKFSSSTQKSYIAQLKSFSELSLLH